MVTVHVTVMESELPLFTVEKTVLHNNVPLLEAFNIPASVIAPVPWPAAKVATYVTTAPDTAVDVSA